MIEHLSGSEGIFPLDLQSSAAKAGHTYKHLWDGLKAVPFKKSWKSKGAALFPRGYPT